MWLLRLVVTGSLVGLVALGLVGFRLSQEPLDLPWVARMIEAQSPLGEGRLEVGSARLAWRGWRSPRSAPLELRLSGLRALDQAGAVRLELPDATAQFSLRALASGRVAPVALVFEGLSLTLLRDAAGRLRLDLGEPAAEATEGTRAEGLLAALTRLVLRDATLRLRDESLGLDVTLAAARLFVVREAAGVRAEGGGVLRLGAASAPLAFTLWQDETGAARVSVEAPSLPRGALADALPAAAALDASLSLAADIRFGPEGGVAGGEARIVAGAGRIALPGVPPVVIDGAEATLRAGPDLLPAISLSARLSPGPLGMFTAPTLAVTVAPRREEGGIAAEVEARLDRLPLGGLLALWPEDVVAGGRAWVADNMEAGLLRDIVLRAGLRVAADGVSAGAISGEAMIEDVTVHWLRPVPPVVGAAGRLTFAGAEVVVDLAGGESEAGAIRVTGGRVRLHELDAVVTDHLADISVALEGEIPALLALLRHPRLALLDRRPLPVAGATGRFAGHAALAFPLDAALTADRIGVTARSTLSDLRIPAVALGQRLDQGMVEVAVTERGLHAAGTARIGDIPAQIEVMLDFTEGPPAQVMESVRVEGRGPAASLIRFLPALSLLSPQGQADVALLLETRRNGRTDIAIRADLARSALAVPALAWSKAAGRPALVETVLRLQAGRLIGTELFRATAPNLSLAGRFVFAANGRLQRIDLADARLFGTRATGEVTPPARGGEPWRIALRGPVLDLAPVLAAPGAEGEGGDSVPLALEARFDRVLLGPDRLLHGLDGRVATGPRGTIAEARLTGRTAEQGGAFSIRVTPRGGGRDVAIEAADAGALLGALGITGAIEGGRLALSARWQGEGAGQPMSGTAELAEFAVRNAPAIGRFLQAITVIGLADLARSQHLAFARAVVPFTLSPGTLALGEARAYSASLGVTATGRVDRLRETLDLSGTVVPAYLLNTLPGRLPIIGRLFSLEQGGGVVAVAWRARGPLAEPEITVNPLSALTPGFLRGLFGQAPGQEPTPP
jgi:hypothetical protein